MKTNLANKIKIRLAKEKDLKDYTHLLQHTYEHACVNESIGLTKECFSKEVFNSEDTQRYLKSILIVNKNQKTWLAFIGNKLIGSITIEKKDNECELKGFYVLPIYQNQGIGKKLFKKVIKSASGKDIVFDIYSHNHKSIAIYKKWGFIIDDQKGKFTRHWPEWPEGLEAECIYMRFRNNP